MVIKRSPIRCGIGREYVKTEEVITSMSGGEVGEEQVTGRVIKWCDGCEECSKGGCPRGRRNFQGAVAELRQAYRGSLI